MLNKQRVLLKKKKIKFEFLMHLVKKVQHETVQPIEQLYRLLLLKLMKMEERKVKKPKKGIRNGCYCETVTNPRPLQPSKH